VSPFDFKLAFQNVDIILVWLLKQSCRTLNLEQLLFLEIFELPYKFGSNFRNQASCNSVISWNSASRRHLTVGELPSTSRRARGHLRLCAGMGRRLRGFFVVLGRAIKPGRCRRPPPLPSSVFPVSVAQFRQASAVTVDLFLSQQSMSPFCLLLANPVDLS